MFGRTCKILLLILLIIMVTNCKSNHYNGAVLINVSSASHPDWIEKSIFKDDEEYIMFVGISGLFSTEREARDDAMIDALKQLAMYSGISIQAFSRLSKKTDEISDSFLFDGTESLSEYSAVISGIHASDKYVETWMIDTEIKFKYHLLIKIEKDKLKSLIKNTLSENKNRIELFFPKTQNCALKVEYASESIDFMPEEYEISEMIRYSLQNVINENNIPMLLEINTNLSSSQFQFIAHVFLDKLLADDGVYKVKLKIVLRFFANNQKILDHAIEKICLSQKSYQQALKNELRNLELTLDENEIWMLRSLS